MKYSVLIPTRNRLEYLRFAVTSVLKQKYDDWEIIISDNASIDDVSGYVASLNDPRIKYYRSETFLTITESWNRSMDLSSGDYVVMLGDDDLLLNGYFKIADRLIADHSPDLIYHESFLFAYPGVIPNFPKGVFQPFGALNAMPKKPKPYWLDHSLRMDIVKETLKFGSIYSTNMQHALIRRSLIDRIKKDGKFFYSPYPDVYAMSALFLEAKNILICPHELVVVGVTPKSHGYFAFNNKQKEAADFLNINNDIAAIPDIHKSLLPPYDSIQTFWLAAIFLLDKHFPLGSYGLKIDYKKYRSEQIKNVFHLIYKDKKAFGNEAAELVRRISFREKFGHFYWDLLVYYMKRICPKFVKTVYLKLKRPVKVKQKIVLCSPEKSYPENRFSNALEIFDQVELKL